MLLEIENLHVKYGNIEALHGINLEVNEGEIITILGANGAGKSTTLLTISGLIKPSQGGIRFNGKPLHILKAHDIVKTGIAQIPEGRRLFGTLTVQENLNMGAFVSTDQQHVQKNRAWIYELFPILKERRHQFAGTLSGGEQQMLAIGRGLMSSPKILLLDEPSLGLAPMLVKTILATLKQINEAGVTIVLVEQNARMALKIAHRGYVMEVGNIVLHDSAEALLANPDVQNAYIGGSGQQQ
jgi:branched-chain amino acid transport system ATP-binding protein